jgi:hypothetical protein
MCAWITLFEMGKRDDSSSGSTRQTREFDTARLAALTKQPLPDRRPLQAHDQPVEDPIFGDSSDPISLGRTKTLDDPMTTGLLAEVARRSQTAEFDEEQIKELLEKVDVGESTHPHTRRRSSK